ncbi:hypothetical protein TSAR_013403, partial [Trichomalopsis sarcophagae]
MTLLKSGPGVTFSHKLSPRTDALLIKRRQKLGPTKTTTLSRGLSKGLEAVHSLLYIHSSIHTQSCPLRTESDLQNPWSKFPTEVVAVYRNDYKTTPNRIGLKPQIALSIRAYESQMTEKRLLKL